MLIWLLEPGTASTSSISSAQNIGYEDQSYRFDFSKAGEHYLSSAGTKVPHVYSTSALTPYVVTGTP